MHNISNKLCSNFGFYMVKDYANIVFITIFSPFTLRIIIEVIKNVQAGKVKIHRIYSNAIFLLFLSFFISFLREILIISVPHAITIWSNF